MSLRTRLRHIEWTLGASALQAQFRRFTQQGVWPSDPDTRDYARSWLRMADAVRLSVPPLPSPGRGVRRRLRERQSTIDRWMEQGTPFDQDALPSLYPSDEEERALEAEVREWTEKFRADGSLPEDEELRRDVVETVDHEDRTSGVDDVRLRRLEDRERAGSQL